MSIATALTALNTDITNARNKIAEMGGTVTPNGGTSQLSADIATIPQGGGELKELLLSSGVNFIDYDGTCVETWNADEVASKTTLPNNPSHDGLTAQGWNWTLDDIQNYISEYPTAVVVVGQMYITDDGTTRIYINLEEGRLSPYLGIGINGSVEIDWGDGTSPTLRTGTNESTIINTQHNYSNSGDYVIRLSVLSGTMRITGNPSTLIWGNLSTDAQNNIYRMAVKKVEIGAGISHLGTGAFSKCYALESVTLPNNISIFAASAFGSCANLKAIVLPSSASTLANANATTNCTIIELVSLPGNLTAIGLSACNACYGLKILTIPSRITKINANTFTNCYTLRSIIIPNDVTSIDEYAFSYCYNLKLVRIPSNVTSIGNYTFRNCYNLETIKIPSGVTSIGTFAFDGCTGLASIRFERSTPPTVAAANAFNGIPTDCVIYVPSGSLNAYKTATNYPNPSTYQYVEY